jgi:nicotinate-nucleotide pyrophosphorylase (carboxylating)
LPEPALRDLVSAALAEDLGSGDITSEAVVAEDAQARARIVQKQAGIFFGLDVAREVLLQSGVEDFEPLAAEGEWRDEVPAEVVGLEGPTRGLLAGERVALNFLAHLSGIATLTARYVAAVEGTGVRILDTRKTTPGLRALEKAAVAAGGGTNHRFGLHDAFLIKENHIAAAGGLAEAVRLAAAAEPGHPVEVECRDLADVAAALDAGAARILLDNMSPDRIREAVALRDSGGEGVTLEASGGVTLETAGAIAAAGVDFVSVGALTHSAPALDLSMLIERG